MSDLFLIIKDANIACYGNDNTPCCTYDNFDDVLARLRKMLEISFNGLATME